MADKKNLQVWNLQTRIYNLLLKESCSDVEFLVGVPPQRHLCHKVILAAGSPVFETMFFGPLQQKSPVSIPDVNERGFALMLQYLYSDNISIENEAEAFEAAFVSKKYIIKSLFGICEKFLLDNITLNPENVLEIHEEATFLEMTNLRNHCLRYVSRNSKKIFHSKSFVRMSKDTFQDILRLDIMNIESEAEVIEALWMWGKEHCKEKGVKSSGENVRKCTKEMLKYVRFFALKIDEVASVLEKCQILDTSEEMALLWNIAMPKTGRISNMPQNICTESRTRSIFNSTKIQLPVNYRYDGNMTAFLIEKYKKDIEITVTGSPVTIIGVVVAFKPIPCYSSFDRSLKLEILVKNCSSAVCSGGKSRFTAVGKDEERQLLLLDNYVVIEEEQAGMLTVSVDGEGVRLMHSMDEEFRCNTGKSEITFKFGMGQGKNKLLFPLKEIMIV